MKLADFFAQAPHARPVNAKPFTFTAVAKGKTLPGGTPNPDGGWVAAQVTGALSFVPGEETIQARLDAAKALRDRATDKDTGVSPATNDGDFRLEMIYQIIWRALCEWDPTTRIAAGASLFPSVSIVRQLVVPREANRVFDAYEAYVESEHPEGGVDAKTFRGTQGGSEGAPALASG